jgi:hypothetical protein
MAFPRRLSDQQLITARREYEATPVSERNLAAIYGLSRSAIHKWIIRQGWTKGTDVRGQALVVAIEAFGGRKIVQSWPRTLSLPPAGKVTKQTKQTKQTTRGGTDGVPAGGVGSSFSDRPHSSQNVPFASPGKVGAADQISRLARFADAGLSALLPGTKLTTGPPPEPRAEAARQGQLSALRDDLVLTQLRQLEQHEELLQACQVLLAVYINPSRYIDVAGLDAEDAAGKLEAVRVQAGRVVLPGKRDTLAGAVLALTKARLATLAAQRTVLGLTPRQTRRSEAHRDEDDLKPPPDLSSLDEPSRRVVMTAMALLKSHAQPHGTQKEPQPPQNA